PILVPRVFTASHHSLLTPKEFSLSQLRANCSTRNWVGPKGTEKRTTSFPAGNLRRPPDWAAGRRRLELLLRLWVLQASMLGPLEVSMKARLTTWSIAFACLSLLVAAAGGGGDAKPARQTVRAEDGLSLVCDVRGKGGTALIFLHGWCGDRAYWKHQVDVFAPDYRVVALDQAGHGESGKDRKVWSADSLAGDVEAVVKALGLKRVILVGHSMGGPVALLAAKRLPGTVIAVVGVDTLQNAEFKMPEEVSKKFLEAFATDFKGTM